VERSSAVWLFVSLIAIVNLAVGYYAGRFYMRRMSPSIAEPPTIELFPMPLIDEAPRPEPAPAPVVQEAPEETIVAEEPSLEIPTVAVEPREIEEEPDAEPELAEASEPAAPSWEPKTLESVIEPRWTDEARREEPYLLALLEIDETDELIQRVGLPTSDRLFNAVARLVVDQFANDGTVHRLEQARFALEFAAASTEEGVDTTERIRQAIAATQFAVDDETIRATASCGVVSISGDESADDFAERAAATLDDARNLGGNRTFLNDGSGSTPVAPPDLALEANLVTV
jgi:diguanylate cyclase (GGDEF)-like protein